MFARRNLSAVCREIFQVGLRSVQGPGLGYRVVTNDGHILRNIGDLQFANIDLRKFERIVMVGGGKAARGAVEGIVTKISPVHHSKIKGIFSVPEGTVVPLDIDVDIQFKAGRLGSVNLPTNEGVAITREMKALVQGADKDTLVIFVFTGGGSALVCEPASGLELEDIINLRKHAAEAGGSIEQINQIAQLCSGVKGGLFGLEAKNAGSVVTFAISDVLNHPPSIIASGPTLSPDGTPRSALKIIADLGVENKLGERIMNHLKNLNKPGNWTRPESTGQFSIIADHNMAKAAAMEYAKSLGVIVYDIEDVLFNTVPVQNTPEDLGTFFAKSLLIDDIFKNGMYCFIGVGEPTVKIDREVVIGPTAGGRSQHMAMIVLKHLVNSGMLKNTNVGVLFGGTDGEDGPCDAAGATFDSRILKYGPISLTAELEKRIREFQSYNFWRDFNDFDSHLFTGPTHTNVCDLWIIIVDNRTGLQKTADFINPVLWWNWRKLLRS